VKDGLFDELARFADTFFNGRPYSNGAVPSRKAVTMAELVRRKSSVIMHAGKLYRVTVEPATVEVKP
jgi:hypothetical protein